jgi:integrative and conjugative element protein (TIGR02256 family)
MTTARYAEMQPGDVIFRSSRNGELRITETVMQDMLKFIQNAHFKLEAGGVVLGKMFESSNNLSVELVTVPNRSDKRSRLRFFRKQRGHQETIDRKWAESNGTINYLGEWHTHPEKVPIPSTVDMNNWISHTKNAKYHGNKMIFLILGTEAIRAFEIFHGEKLIYPLKFILSDGEI